MEKNNYILNIEEFSLYLQAEKIFSGGTILLYKTVLERFFQFCSQNQNELVLPKTWRYSDIRVRDLEAFLATDKKENQRYHETQVTYLSGIRSFFRYLVEKNFIETNPFQHYVLSRGFREMILIDDAISEIKKDLKKIDISQFQGSRNRLLIEIALNHGLTAKEIVSISNIEKASKQSVWVVFQNNSVLEIPVTTEFLAILDEYKKNLNLFFREGNVYAKEKETVILTNNQNDMTDSTAEHKNGFWYDDKNMPLKPETLVRQVNKTFKMIGLPKMNFKILREWTTQKFAEAGADIRSLQNMRQIKGIRRLKSLYKNDFGNLQNRFNVTHKRNKTDQ